MLDQKSALQSFRPEARNARIGYVYGFRSRHGLVPAALSAGIGLGSNKAAGDSWRPLDKLMRAVAGCAEAVPKGMAMVRRD